MPSKSIYFKRGSISTLIITDFYFTSVTEELKRNDFLLSFSANGKLFDTKKESRTLEYDFS